MISSFTIELTPKNCRKILLMSKLGKIEEKPENILMEIEKKSLEEEFNKEKIKNYIKINYIEDEIIKKMNFIYDNEGSVFFSDNNFFSSIESSILFFYEKNHLPLNMYFCNNIQCLFNIKKFIKYFNNKYNLDIKFSVNDTSEECNNNVVNFFPLDVSFRFINKFFLGRKHKSAIFFNFLSNRLNKNKELSKNSFNESKCDISGLVSFCEGYTLNQFPVIVIEELFNDDILKSSFMISKMINFYSSDIFIDDSINFGDYSSNEIKIIALLFGIYVKGWNI